jgi:transposase
MHQSRTLEVGMGVHHEAIAVADVAKDHDADVIDLGTSGSRHVAIEPLIRQLQSKAKHLVLVDEAGPCGYELSRHLTQQGSVRWVVAPSVMPHKAGDRVQTDSRDAVPLARLMRAGELTRVSVPTVEDEAMCELSRAREDMSRALNAAKLRLKAFVRRHDLRSTHPRGRTRRPDPLRASPTREERSGPDPLSRCPGERRRQGSITTAGNAHARRALVEGAGASRDPAQGSRPVQRSRAHQPTPRQDLSGKAPVRRYQRFRRLRARGPHAHQVVVAMARELVGFLGALAHQVPGIWPPTDASQGGANPSRAAGAPVGYDWRRLFRWTTCARGPS